MFDQTPNNNPTNGFMGVPGYQYNGMQQPQVKINNTLTPDEIKTLQQQHYQFTLGLTDIERAKGICNHRSIDGLQDTLTFDSATGTARCTICGYEFSPVDDQTSQEEITAACQTVINYLQTIKIMFHNLPENAAREYFQIIPLIMKIPELFKFAAKDFNKNEFNAWSYNNGNMGGIQMLQNMQNAFGMYNMYGQQQQPYMNQPMGAPAGFPQQPMMGGAPAGFPQAAYGTGNAFGYAGASQQPQGYQPMNPGYQFQPQAGTTPAQPTVNAPAAPAAPADAKQPTVTEKVSV